MLTTAARPSASQLQTTCDTPASQFVCASYLDDICPCLPVWPCTRNCANKTVRKRQTVWDFWDFTPKLDVILLKFESAPSLEESPPGAQTLTDSQCLTGSLPRTLSTLSMPLWEGLPRQRRCNTPLEGLPIIKTRQKNTRTETSTAVYICGIQTDRLHDLHFQLHICNLYNTFKCTTKDGKINILNICVMLQKRIKTYNLSHFHDNVLSNNHTNVT